MLHRLVCRYLWLAWLQEETPTMPPSTEYMWSPNGLMNMTLTLYICHGLLIHQIRPNRAFMEYSGTMPETAFSTSIEQVWVDWLSRERMVFQTSSRIPDAGGLYATAHTGRTGRTWWPNTLLSDFTLVFPLLVWSLIPQNDTNPVRSLFPGYCDHHCPSPLLPQLFLFGSCRLICSFCFHLHMIRRTGQKKMETPM